MSTKGMTMLGWFLSLTMTVATTATAGDTIALKVDRVLTGTGQVVEGGYLVIKDGKVAEVGAKKAPDGAWVMEFDGATACPGFIDPITDVGARGALEETARAFTPTARAADSLDPYHSDFRKAAQGGVTTVGLSPASSNLVGGSIAVVHTSGSGGAATLSGDGPMRLSLGPSALQWNRKPTSRMGAAHELRQFVANGVPGKGALVVDARSADEIRLVRDILKPAGRPLVILRPGDGSDVIHALGDKSHVVLGPFNQYTSTRTLQLAARLRKGGVAIAFTGGGNVSSLRVTAALAMRNGLSREDAIAALTAVPAHMLGVGGSTGTLEKGRRADVVVFGGDPLDLGAPVRAVLVGGVPIDLEKE